MALHGGAEPVSELPAIARARRRPPVRRPKSGGRPFTSGRPSKTPRRPNSNGSSRRRSPSCRSPTARCCCSSASRACGPADAAVVCGVSSGGAAPAAQPRSGDAGAAARGRPPPDGGDSARGDPMNHDDLDAPDLRSLASLPSLAPSDIRQRRVRSRCHAALARAASPRDRIGAASPRRGAGCSGRHLSGGGADGSGSARLRSVDSQASPAATSSSRS